ncbi:membrane protein [Kosmotoga arenicorallina S304]|uniref:Membrane protein n=1 Tax=Kosmotoga arenicorallina S304 TaxID=1453497 RepID=A0A176K3R9_9BACT|nr:DUF554 domain-containing protein [Kosmotoga arenicorallina]OAA31681.1 membrane protein [Kosmotoga arenicorallina S304]
MFNISVIVNTIAVLIGSSLGIFGGKWLSEKYRKVLFKVIGLLTIGLGIKMFFEYSNALVVLGSMAIGGIVGEALELESKIGKLTGNNKSEDFVTGFITATLLFVAGPMTVIGSIKAGIEGNNEIIFLKSLMDGISSVMLAASFGSGVLFSAISVYLVQGGLVSLASVLNFLQQPSYLGDFSGTGGLTLLALGIRLLEIKEIKVGNFLPALIVSPVLTFVSGIF